MHDSTAVSKANVGAMVAKRAVGVKVDKRGGYETKEEKDRGSSGHEEEKEDDDEDEDEDENLGGCL